MKQPGKQLGILLQQVGAGIICEYNMETAMHSTKLRKVGGSVMLAVPPAILDMLRLRAGTTVGVCIDDGRLVVHPRPSPRYTLADLLAQCDPLAERDADDQSCLDAPSVGRELL